MPFIIEKERDSLYKDGLERGRKERQEQERRKGSRETKISIAKAMIKQQMSIEMISKLTGLSKEEIEKLR